ncbi:MAG: hypothetical protein ACLVJO_02685 [[Clostridium] scindens]
MTTCIRNYFQPEIGSMEVPNRIHDAMGNHIAMKTVPYQKQTLLRRQGKAA